MYVTLGYFSEPAQQSDLRPEIRSLPPPWPRAMAVQGMDKSLHLGLYNRQRRNLQDLIQQNTPSGLGL